MQQMISQPVEHEAAGGLADVVSVCLSVCWCCGG